MDEQHNNNETNAENMPPTFSEEEMKMPEGTVVESSVPKQKNFGVILALLIVALVLILGGLYLWYVAAFQTPAQTTAVPTAPERPAREVPDMPNEPEAQNADATVQQLETVSTSNDMGAIEADLDATNLDDLDTELNSIDAEINAAMQEQQ